MDVLVMEDFVLEKTAQPLGLRPLLQSTSRRVDDAASPWADPATRDPLIVSARCAHNPVTGTCYPVVDGIPQLYVPMGDAPVTETASSLYEERPFPDYEGLETPRALIEHSRGRLFARLLNEQIPHNAAVLEVGCGTGQLTNFLAIAHRAVVGIDVRVDSLRIAQRFKEEHDLQRATFARMNVLRPALKDDFFDVVISNGAWHQSSDYGPAFARICRLVKPGGYVVIGFYSAYSRKLHQTTRGLLRWSRAASPWADPHMRGNGAASSRHGRQGDQPCYSGETGQTLDRVLDWMRENGIQFVNSIPGPSARPTLAVGKRLFDSGAPGNPVSRCLSQITDMGSADRDAGFFIVIGRRQGGIHE
jgi:ubiquinone/menaquinone biosynthesis C-methylase UbiE